MPAILIRIFWAVVSVLPMQRILAAIPVERLVAAMLNRMLTRIDPANVARARVSARHLSELAGLMADMLKDATVSPEELTQLRESIISARKDLLDAWANGESGAIAQNEIHVDAGPKIYSAPLTPETPAD